MGCSAVKKLRDETNILQHETQQSQGTTRWDAWDTEKKGATGWNVWNAAKPRYHEMGHSEVKVLWNGTHGTQQGIAL